MSDDKHARGTPPGNWENTIHGMAMYNHLGHFEYTTGPFSVHAP